ncbi:N-acetyltransferase [Uliginosibacterium flavum]|uniref:GNAT family N-acetyltransferase n=1 Tax=Uliginosibacterium flavum TaxID=1396831 RepID=A0ABV2TNV0_9RHOO
MPELQIRTMRPTDLSAVFALQICAYPAEYHEPVEALASRLAAGAEFCFVAQLAGQLAGYVFAHPWVGDPPALHVPLAPIVEPEHVFIHDLAVSPACRRASTGKRLQAAVLESATRRDFADMRLVAVGAARLFWQGMGFRDFPCAELHPAYGEAVVMGQQIRA